MPQQVRNDVQDLHAVLIDPQLCAYPPENVTLLLDSQATQAAIRQALAELAGKTDGDSTLLIYISSHGAQIATGAFADEYLLQGVAREGLENRALGYRYQVWYNQEIDHHLLL